MEKKTKLLILGSGIAVGAAAILLRFLGNPANMGFCIACFLRDTAGALHLHAASAVQYPRPEIAGLILGAFVCSLLSKEFQARGGSSPVSRFLIGAVVMLGALAFLGCPLRMVLRMGGGDGNAFVGFCGFAIGILIGIFFLRRGFTLRRSYPLAKAEGVLFPLLAAVPVLFLLIAPEILALSESGPGSQHAPLLVSLLVSMFVGALAQKSRLCMVGGMRDAVMFRDFHLLSGFAALFVTVLLGNLLTGSFGGVSFLSQPIAHSAHLWNLLGMVLVGWGSVLLGGCPLRQLILAGEGNGDSAVTVLGMLFGAAVSHNFGLAGAADSVADGVYKVGGISANGKAAVLAGLAVLLLLSCFHSAKQTKSGKM